MSLFRQINRADLLRTAIENNIPSVLRIVGLQRVSRNNILGLKSSNSGVEVTNPKELGVKNGLIASLNWIFVIVFGFKTTFREVTAKIPGMERCKRLIVQIFGNIHCKE